MKKQSLTLVIVAMLLLAVWISGSYAQGIINNQFTCTDIISGENLSDFAFLVTGHTVCLKKQPKKSVLWETDAGMLKGWQATPVKELLIPAQLPDWQQHTLAGQWQQLADNRALLSGLSPNSHSDSPHWNQHSIFLSLINQQFRIVVMPSGKMTDSVRHSLVDFVLHSLLQVYRQLLNESGQQDLVNEVTETVAVIAAAGSSGGGDDDGDDDGDKRGKPPNPYDDEPDPFIIYESPQWLPMSLFLQHLWDQSLQRKRHLLKYLHRRIERVIQSGNHQLAAVLRDRIMVIEADRDELLNLADPDSQLTDRSSYRAVAQALLADAEKENEYDREQSGSVILQPGQGVGYSRGNGTGKSESPPDRQKANKEAESGSASDQNTHKPPDQERNKKASDSDGDEGEDGAPWKRPKMDEQGKPELMKIPLTLNSLPVTALDTIFSLLSLKDQLNLSCINQYFRNYYLELPATVILQRLLRRYFSSLRSALNPPIPCSEPAFINHAAEILSSMQVPEHIIARCKKVPLCLAALLRYFFVQGKLAPGRVDSIETHNSYPGGIVLLPGNRLACGYADDTVKIWNIETKRCEFTLKGHSSFPRTLAVLPCNTLVSGSNDGTVKLWNTGTGHCEATLQAHSNWVMDLAVLTDGRLASASFDGTVKLWNIDNRSCEMTLTQEDPVRALAALPDNCLAIAVIPDIIKFFDIARKRYDTELKIGKKMHFALFKALPTGWLATISRDPAEYDQLSFWDIESRSLADKIKEKDSKFSSLVMLPDGRLLASGIDIQLRIWNIETMALEFKMRCGWERAWLIVLADGRIARIYCGAIEIWEIYQPVKNDQ